MSGLDRVLIEQPKGALMFRYGIGSRVALASLIGWLDERLPHRTPDVTMPEQRLPADNPERASPAARGHARPAPLGGAGVRVCGPYSRRRVIAHPHPQANEMDLRPHVKGSTGLKEASRDGSRRARVALIDRRALLTGCLATTLEGIGYDTRIVFVPTPPLAVTVERAAREVRSFTPQVVILGCDLGPHGESEALLALLSSSGVPVVVLAQENDDAQWGAFVVRGARAVVPQTASLASVCAAVRLLAAGMPAMTRAEQERLVAAYRAESGARHHDRELLATLTPNETEILRLLMAGCSPTEMALSRVVSVSTVRTQVKWILSKLEVHSQLAAVATAFRAGWSPTPTTPSTRSQSGAYPLARVSPAA